MRTLFLVKLCRRGVGGRSIAEILRHFLPPFGFQREGLFGIEVVCHRNRTAIGINLAVSTVVKFLIDGDTGGTDFLNPRAHEQVGIETGLTAVVGVGRDENQTLRIAIDSFAEHFGVKLHFTDIEIVLQIDVVDVSEAVGIRETYLYIAVYIFSHIYIE